MFVVLNAGMCCDFVEFDFDGSAAYCVTVFLREFFFCFPFSGYPFLDAFVVVVDNEVCAGFLCSFDCFENSLELACDVAQRRSLRVCDAAA